MATPKSGFGLLGFLLAFYISHSPKVHRFELGYRTDRQPDGRTVALPNACYGRRLTNNNWLV